MVLKVSATAAKVVAVDLKAIRPDPSATTWSRLEPLPTADDVSLGLQAPVADPLWLLARQWQFNELQGEDAGSPIGARLRVQGVPMRRLLHPAGGVPATALPEGAPPLEAMVERERVLAAHPKLNAQAGQQLLRLLRAAGRADAVAPLLAAFPAAITAPSDPAADNAGFVWHRLLHGRSVDAHVLATAFGAAVADDAEGFVAALGIADAPAVAEVLKRWLRWVDDLALDPRSDSGASPYWNPQRLEYGFALASEGVQPELRLQADEYVDGRLDWDDFVVTSVLQPGQGAAGAASIDWQPQRPPMPAMARYPGMPADRYWEFEDGRLNFGAMGAAKSDLARLALLEYALVYGNDWYVLPVTLPVNALYKVAEFFVRDNFGIEVPIPPARKLDGSQWTMFEMSVRAAAAPRARLDDCLFLCPALHAQEGPALEHVLLMRDEMANLAWAIEKRVQGTSGEPLDRRFESTRLSTTQTLRVPLGAVPAPGAPLQHTLQTPVAANWIPFLPVKRAGATEANWSIQLQRGVVVQHLPVDPVRLAEPRNAETAAVVERLRTAPFVETRPEQAGLQGFMFHPRGEILRTTPADAASLFTTDFLRLEDEEVPRDGIEVRRAFNYARDASGRALLWIGRSKNTGRGEGASGLRFDLVRRAGGGG